MAKPKKNNKANYKQRQIMKEQHYNGLIAKIAAAFLITILAFYPVYVGPRVYLGITYEKTFFFWMATLIAAALVAFMFICAKGSLRILCVDDYYVPDEPGRRVTIAEWALIGFIAWAFLSAFIAHWLNPEWFNRSGYSIRPGQIVWRGYGGRYEGFFSYLAYAACFFIIARLYKPKRLHMLLIASGAAIVSLIGILQFAGLDFLPWRMPAGNGEHEWVFGLFPFELNNRQVTDIHGNPLMGPLSAFFRTTLGNVNLVSAYCSFAVMLFIALFATSGSKKWRWVYFGACMLSFALGFTTGHSGDAHTVAITGAMLLLVPYWISDRERFGRILIMLSGWLVIFAAHNAYMTHMQRQLQDGAHFPPRDVTLLVNHAPANLTLIFILAAALLAAGLALTLALKKWIPARPLKITCIAIVPVLMISGLIGLEIIGSRLYGQPHNFIWQAREMMHFRMSDSFGSGRGFIWRNAMEVIPYNPIFGTGPDTFYYALGGFGSERQTIALALHREVYDKAHNVFLQIAVCMGIPALLAYLIFLGGVFIPAVKAAFNRPVLLAFGAAALSYVIQGFFMVEVPITTPLVWIAFGVIAAETWMARVGCESAEV